MGVEHFCGLFSPLESVSINQSTLHSCVPLFYITIRSSLTGHSLFCPLRYVHYLENRGKVLSLSIKEVSD